MWKVNGNDVFENNIYSWHAWSAEILQAPEEVYACFAKLNLFNKKIAEIRAIGYGYNLRDDYFQGDDDDANYSSDEKTIPCQVEIDQPILIVFEDGDRLEMDFSEGGSIRISKNCIPVDIATSVNYNNFDANKFFSCCIAQRLVKLDVKRTTRCPVFTGSYGMRLADLEEYIESVWLTLSNGIKLKFEARDDYGVVTATDKTAVPLEINLDELKQGRVPKKVKRGKI